MSAATRPSLTQRLGLLARRLRLARPAYRALERYRGLSAGRDPGAANNGLPVPPPYLRVLVAGDADLNTFLAGGRLGAQVLADAVSRNAGKDMADLRAILDFGCGCGRVARHWAGLRGPELHGCDYNARLVAWCDRNLRFMRAWQNALEPPLPYPDQRFDFVYALSVFTHLSEPMQHRWMSEMRRILEPGGLLMFTTKGDSHAHELDKLGRGGLADYRSGHLVVTDASLAGMNLCAAYHPQAWVLGHMLRGFELLEASPSGATMNGGQDFYLVRRVD
jgi:SAM-dependent methyltransferase